MIFINQRRNVGGEKILFDLFNRTLSVIDEWIPNKHKNELEYRNELLQFLRSKMNEGNNLFSIEQEIVIKKEDGRGLCDIAIENEVGIELKKDLNSKSKVDRLIGQVNYYKKHYKDIIIVLVGVTDPNALDYLKEQLRSIASTEFNTIVGTKHLLVIDKGSNITNVKRNKDAMDRDPFRDLLGF